MFASAPEELARLAIVVAGIVALSLGVQIGRRVLSRRAERTLAAPPVAALATGRPTLLYFHGDRCGDCFLQERELDQLLAARPEVAIRADHAPSALSAQFRVLTVPTTVVLDGSGRAHAVNYGLTARGTLERQLVEVEEALSETA